MLTGNETWVAKAEHVQSWNERPNDELVFDGGVIDSNEIKLVVLVGHAQRKMIVSRGIGWCVGASDQC